MKLFKCECTGSFSKMQSFGVNASETIFVISNNLNDALSKIEKDKEVDEVLSIEEIITDKIIV